MAIAMAVFSPASLSTLHNHPSSFYISHNNASPSSSFSFPSLSPHPTPNFRRCPSLLSVAALCAAAVLPLRSLSVLSRRTFSHGGLRVSRAQESVDGTVEDLEFDLGINGMVYRKTLRLVECSMFAAVAGLTYLMSDSLAIEKYFGCFFSLPIVISSVRWGVAAGRKTTVATAMLLLVLSGPVKALTYLLMHGLAGFAMGSLWSVGVNWGLSVLLCSIVRAIGTVGYVLLSSFLIRENILALITINIHVSLAYLWTAMGFNTIPSMNTIYAIFGSLVLLNNVSFVFLVHILYAIFLARLGMKTSLTLPRWLQKAL